VLNLNNLHPYQQKIIQKSSSMPHMGLLMDMGLGKTITTLSIIKGKTLIIAPKAVAKNVWMQEAKNWEHTQKLKFALLVGTVKERESALQENADVYLINVENVVWLVDQKVIPKWDSLVIDESSRFKNPGSKRWKSLKKILGTFKSLHFDGDTHTQVVP